jgi:uncharacterized protein YycO
MFRTALLIPAFTLLATAACSHSVMVHRPADQEVDTALTKMWTSEIARVAQDGDWLLVRSYASVGDAIVVLTSGEEISHAAMYDGKTGTVIEAITPVVREVPLEELVGRNRYLIVVRPRATAAEKRASVMRARSALGTSFDLRGMFGVADRKDRFYCSELVYWAGGVADKDNDEHFIITPVSLIDHGEVVYFSGRRDDAQLQRVARGWAVEHPTITVASAPAARGE